MKACVFIKQAKKGRGRGGSLSLLQHCLGQGRSKPEVEVGLNRVVGVDAYGLVGAVNPAHKEAIRDNLLRHHHHGKSRELIKHVVLSMEDMQDIERRRIAMRILRRMAHIFLKKYANNSPAIAICHADKLHPHIHILICNSDGERALHWTPKMLREMQSMTWLTTDLTKLVQSGRKAHRKAIHNTYPKAKLSVAMELATMAPDELEKVPWITRGNTRVFLWKNRRIRERTITKERNRIYETQSSIQLPNHIDPASAWSDRQEIVSSRTKALEEIKSHTCRNGDGITRSDEPNTLVTAIRELQGFRRKKLVSYEPTGFDL